MSTEALSVIKIVQKLTDPFWRSWDNHLVIHQETGLDVFVSRMDKRFGLFS